MTHAPDMLLVAYFRVPPCSEWATNQHRDSIASHVGHSDMLAYFAVAENNATGRVRYQLLEVKHGFAGLRPTETEKQTLRCIYFEFISWRGSKYTTPDPMLFLLPFGNLSDRKHIKVVPGRGRI